MTYRNVYFRLNSGYMTEHENTKAFFEDITKLFISNGWEIEEEKYSCSCPTVRKDKNRLYLHPQSASGEVEEDMIPDIEHILSYGTEFKHYHTDTYEILYDMTDDEYRTVLDSKRDKIKKDLLECFKTKRKNLFVTDTCAVVMSVKERYHIPRLQAHLGRSSSDIEWGYVGDALQELIDAGAFETAETKHGTGFRTKTTKAA